jgi:aerobic-type carbon monoxide dehydrogenase small subunit (CoxS/CutS family)
MKLETISFTLNGRVYQLEVPANRTLLDLIREDLGFTGTKRGCEIGECGACTVLLDGIAVNSCLVLAPQAHGKKIITVEGLMENGKLHPLQEAFLDNDAVHCGFCSPGMLISALALFNANPSPSDEEIKIAISGNLCRCTGYWPIINAIKQYRDTHVHQSTP